MRCGTCVGSVNDSATSNCLRATMYPMRSTMRPLTRRHDVRQAFSGRHPAEGGLEVVNGPSRAADRPFKFEQWTSIAQLSRPSPPYTSSTGSRDFGVHRPA